MLRFVVGDQNFLKLLKAVPDKFAWKPVSTDDFRGRRRNAGRSSIISFCNGSIRRAPSSS
jgi:hypothetical protein